MQWVGLVAVSLPGLAALAALLFTWMQVDQTRKELQIGEQGQITNRFNAAVRNLGSESRDVRLGGIYGLERIMQDSARDHPTVVSVLSAYVRQNAPLPASGTKKTQTTATEHSPRADVQAVMNVLANRRPGRDRGALVDLSRTDLRGLKPTGGSFRSYYTHELDINFREANFEESDLSGADLQNADLREAWMAGTNLSTANLIEANLRQADLSGANLINADFCLELTVGETGSKFVCADLTGASLDGAKLAGAFLPHAKLTGATLSNADLTGANLTDADLTDADLTYANLTNADLTRAKLDGVRGLPSSLH